MQQSIHDISLSRSPWRYPVLYWQHHPGRLLVAVFHSRTLFVSPSIGIPAVGAELREHTRSVSADATQIQHRIRLLYGGCLYRFDDPRGLVYSILKLVFWSRQHSLGQHKRSVVHCYAGIPERHGHAAHVHVRVRFVVPGFRLIRPPLDLVLGETSPVFVGGQLHIV